MLDTTFSTRLNINIKRKVGILIGGYVTWNTDCVWCSLKVKLKILVIDIPANDTSMNFKFLAHDDATVFYYKSQLLSYWTNLLQSSTS